jgi:hypothetical protein
MSPNQGSRWTTWGTISSGFREIEIGWDRLGSVGHVAPFVAPARTSPTAVGGSGLGRAPKAGHLSDSAMGQGVSASAVLLMPL